MKTIDTDHVSDETWDIAKKISDDNDADILLLNSPMQRPLCSFLIHTCINRKHNGTKKSNVILMLVTAGGNADVAYRIGSYLQKYYDRVSVYVTGYCKSAGTLLALAGTELVFSDHGELGPLDVQMRKENNLLESQSGLDVMESLTAIRDKAWLAFESSFIEIQTSSGGSITVESAGKMASDMAVGLYAPLIARLDPMHIGEASRANSVALHYGKKLIDASQNSDDTNLARLVSDYPSHSFVIDRREAEQRFRNVRPPNEDEILLAYGLGRYCRTPRDSDGDGFEFVNDTAEAQIENRAHAQNNDIEENPVNQPIDKQNSTDTAEGGITSGSDDQPVGLATDEGAVTETGDPATTGEGSKSDESDPADKAHLQSV